MTPWMTLLRAVEQLHEAGFEQVRALPYFYALGTWRCELTVGGSGSSMGREDFFRYSSAAEWNYFGDYDKQTTVERLANRLTKRIPDPSAAKAASPGYRFWYSSLLSACRNHEVPYLFREYENCVELGYVGIVGDSGGSEGNRFPLPPTD